MGNVSIKDRILVFMRDTLLFELDGRVTEETDLFQSGALDSSGYISLIKYIEKEFDIRLSEDEVLSNVLVSLSSIVEFVSQKQLRDVSV